MDDGYFTCIGWSLNTIQRTFPDREFITVDRCHISDNASERVQKAEMEGRPIIITGVNRTPGSRTKSDNEIFKPDWLSREHGDEGRNHWCSGSN